MATVENIDFERFFREVGRRLRSHRMRKGWAQEDLIQFGFSARHYQMMEAGRPITLTTLLRLAVVFGVTPSALLRGIPVAVEAKPRRRPRKDRPLPR